MRLPEELCESMLEQAYEGRPLKLFAWAMGYACRILEAMTDEKTAEQFNVDTVKLFNNAILSYASEKISQHERKNGEEV